MDGLTERALAVFFIVFGSCLIFLGRWFLPLFFGVAGLAITTTAYYLILCWHQSQMLDYGNFFIFTKIILYPTTQGFFLLNIGYAFMLLSFYATKYLKIKEVPFSCILLGSLSGTFIAHLIFQPIAVTFIENFIGRIALQAIAMCIGTILAGRFAYSYDRVMTRLCTAFLGSYFVVCGICYFIALMLQNPTLCSWKPDWTYNAFEYGQFNTTSLQDCCSGCNKDLHCARWAFLETTNTCTLHFYDTPGNFLQGSRAGHRLSNFNTNTDWSERWPLDPLVLWYASASYRQPSWFYGLLCLWMFLFFSGYCYQRKINNYGAYYLKVFVSDSIWEIITIFWFILGVIIENLSDYQLFSNLVNIKSNILMPYTIPASKLNTDRIWLLVFSMFFTLVIFIFILFVVCSCFVRRRQEIDWERWKISEKHWKTIGYLILTTTICGYFKLIVYGSILNKLCWKGLCPTDGFTFGLLFIVTPSEVIADIEYPEFLQQMVVRTTFNICRNAWFYITLTMLRHAKEKIWSKKLMVLSGVGVTSLILIKPIGAAVCFNAIQDDAISKGKFGLDFCLVLHLINVIFTISMIRLILDLLKVVIAAQFGGRTSVTMSFICRLYVYTAMIVYCLGISVVAHQSCPPPVEFKKYFVVDFVCTCSYAVLVMSCACWVRWLMSVRDREEEEKINARQYDRLQNYSLDSSAMRSMQSSCASTYIRSVSE